MTLISNLWPQQAWILELAAVLSTLTISDLKSSICVAYQKDWEVTWLQHVSTFTGRKYKGFLI